MNHQDVKVINCSGSVWPLQTSHTLLTPPADPVKSSVRVNLRPSGGAGGCSAEGGGTSVLVLSNLSTACC